MKKFCINFLHKGYKKQLFVFPLLSFFVLFSCRQKEKTEWDMGIKVPLAKGELNMASLIDNKYLKDTNSNLKAVYVQNLVNNNSAGFIHVKDTSLKISVKLQNIQLGTRRLTRKISLGEVAANAGPPFSLIVFKQGDSTQVPPASNISSGDV